MYEDNYLMPVRSITCLVHKKQRATHLCTQLQCLNNPILCQQCFQDSKFRSSHITHESSLKPINEGIQILADTIKKQSKPVQVIYEKTFGHRDNDAIKTNLQKAQYLTEQMDSFFNNIKSQLDQQIQLLTKQFQRQILIEKQQFLRRLDEYKRTFFSNLQTLKRQSSQIMQFESTLKFYGNPNALLLKLSTEAQKRSLEWILTQKKVLQKMSRYQSSYIQPSSYTALQSLCQKTNDMNMMKKPFWIGQKKEMELQLKGWIKTNIQSWLLLPELRDLSKSTTTGSHHSSSHQFRATGYSPQSVGMYGGTYSTNMM